MHSVAFGRVLREYPVGVRVKAVHSVAFGRVLREYPVGVRVKVSNEIAYLCRHTFLANIHAFRHL